MSLVMNNYYLNSVLSPCFPPSSPTIPHFHAPKWQIRCHRHHHRYPMISTVSYPLRRHHHRRRSSEKPNQSKPSPPADQKLQMVLDIEHVSRKASLAVRRLLSSSKLRFDELVQSGNEALEDLQTLITVDADRRVIFSCRRSTLQFVGNLVLWSCVIVFALRVLVKLGLGFWGRLGFGINSGLIWRRDRSLGGREVVVARKRNPQSNFKLLKNPLSPAMETATRSSEAMQKTRVWRTEGKKLPTWWPVLLPPPAVTVDNQKYQRMANRLIRAIMDYRISGKDISEDDIIHFRRICRTSGARVSIDTANARDSLYRASVDFVLNICGSAENQSTSLHIDGEDPRQFIAGLADNICLENTRAARIVSATVAARTRSCFLQAWALQMQGKHSEAVVELSKICLIHRIFPPEECSPEMEMVARGLEKHLKVEQREFLMDMLVEICGKGNHSSMAEALGLVPSAEGFCNEQASR
ncbi:hypothetical protein U1Q18_030475 [Sarracenia purpurea var. burkii]